MKTPKQRKTSRDNFLSCEEELMQTPNTLTREDRCHAGHDPSGPRLRLAKGPENGWNEGLPYPQDEDIMH